MNRFYSTLLLLPVFVLDGSILLAGTASADPGWVRHAAPGPLSDQVVTSDWPCLLGPTHNQASPETHLLHRFPKDGLKVVWEVNKGEGYASPVIRRDRLAMFHRVGDEEIVECRNATTGERVWQFAYPTAYRDRYGYCNGPRSSPAVTGDAVFAIGAQGKLHCLELSNGQVRWKRDLLAEFHLRQNFFGVGSTPLVVGDRLIVNVGACPGPCVAAFDVRTGRHLWGAGDQWGPSYASPIPATLYGKRRVLVFAGGESRPPTGGVLCIDPENGHVDFTYPWRGNRRESVNASSPLISGNQVFVSECYGAGGVLLDVSPDLQCKPVWTNPNFGTHFMTAIVQDGYLYGVDGHGPDDAFLVCVDLKSGKEMWRAQPEWKETVAGPDGPRQIPTGTYRCWLMPADGQVLCLGEFGHLLWLKLSPKGYEALDRVWLFAASETWTPPVISRGLLYICQNTRDMLRHTAPRVLCYDLRGN